MTPNQIAALGAREMAKDRDRELESTLRFHPEVEQLHEALAVTACRLREFADWLDER